jgi:hypothetical protein
MSARSSQDFLYALTLISGFAIVDGSIQKTKFPSSRTKPTENECRAAIARELMRDDPRRGLLWGLAALFDASTAGLRPQRRLVFKNLGTSRHDPDRDMRIAMLMHGLQHRDGLSYNDAAAKTAEMIGHRDDRRVKKIFGKWRALLKQWQADGEARQQPE